MPVIPVMINQSSIDNGRIYIDASHKALLGDIRLGTRSKDAVGDLVTIEAGSETYETDIRESSAVRLSPRSSFKRYLASVCASDGDSYQLTEIGPRRYRLEPTSRTSLSRSV